ncbi:ABC transporter substrate-binding protein [Rhodovastum atsumiense]|uniref:ABC transporter substrate-binding protein n=1 Tax=Rhodovastum atsumiense TaxID=504468 RepID=A0A5M6IP56_9PROT|nr:ABC transporter substrate-binding protein [Rhodovastum atsumiense]KAA5610050.1 ABC transporter substrate-binding protein [Rhodovastum atsumiense]CAH2602955.1 ABC transporter substrate-binding protein [Rhodovastum atsumiense]
MTSQPLLSRRWLLAAGCAAVALPPDGPATAAPAPAPATPVRGGTLNAIIQPEPPLLVMGLNQQAPTQTVAGKIYESLLTYDFELNPKPSLARAWEVSADGLTYTFHLQDGVKWHDGAPFSARDVVFTFKTFLMETHPRARALFGRCSSIEAIDDTTVVFRLSEPFPAFLQCFEVSNAPLMPAHIYEGTDFRANPKNATPIGTGPFRFDEWVKGSHIHLVAFPEYWQKGKPYLKDIYFRIIPDAASRALALETGEVMQSQFTDIEPFDVPRLVKNPKLQMTKKGYEFVAPLMWLELNTRVKPLDDKRFRQAIMYALDRQFIRDKIWFGLGRVATGPINSVTKFYDPNVRKYPYDPAKAKALLDEMGLKPDAKGVRASLKFMPLPYGETWLRLGEYIKQALGRVGIAITLESTDAAGWGRREANWDFDITANMLYQYADPAIGVARTYLSSNIRKGVMFTNTMGYSNPEVDTLFEQAAREVDPAKRQALYSRLQKILVEDVPVAWLLELEFPTIQSRRLHNAITTAIGVNETYADAWLDAS